MEDAGVIEKYTIKINKKKLGFTIDCIVEVTIKNGQYEKFRTFIKNYKHSEWGYRITGDGCFLIKLSVKTLSDIEDFINEILPYAYTKTFIAFSETEIDDNIDKFLKE